MSQQNPCQSSIRETLLALDAAAAAGDHPFDPVLPEWRGFLEQRLARTAAGASQEG